MDPFEEFEFKPITEGLGFHKRKATGATNLTPHEVEPLSPVEASLLRNQGLNLLQDESSSKNLSTPLPRQKNGISSDSSKVDSKAVDEILKSLQKKKNLDLDLDIRKELRPGKKEVIYKLSHHNMGALILDGMLITSSFLLSVVVLLIVTKIDLIKNLSHPDENFLIYWAAFGLLTSVLFIYMVVNRAFLTCTPGEWAFDQRLGLPKDFIKWTYIPRVALRTFLLIITGLILLPLLSKILSTDLLGKMSGLKIYERG